jgi:hypothetical protein
MSKGSSRLATIVIVVSAVLILVLIDIVWSLSSIEGILGRLEIRVEELSHVIEAEVVTKTATTTVTYTATGVSPPFPPPVPGFPFESIIAGLLLGVVLILLVHREARLLRSNSQRPWKSLYVGYTRHSNPFLDSSVD